MFELMNEDLEDCLEILRQISNESGIDRSRIMAEHCLNKSDIAKTVELCELLIYHYRKIEETE